jgi:hypothetical protein
MKNDIDTAEIAKLVIELGKINMNILKLFPDRNDKRLKHLAASAIHTTLFIKDVYEDKEDLKLVLDEQIKEFLDKCGCKND